MRGRVVKAIRRIVVAGIIACTAAGGGGLWLARSQRGQQWVAGQVRAALGPSVRFAEARITPWPLPLAVQIEGIEVLGRDGAPIARVRSVVGRIRLAALLGRPPLVARVALDGVEADITRAADGAVTLGGQPLDGAAGGPARPGLDAACPQVDLTDGRLTLRDTSNASAPVVQIEDITARVIPTRPGAHLTLVGRSAQVGDVRASLHLESLNGIATAPFRAEVEAREADATPVAAWLPRGGGALTMSGRGRLTATLHGRPNAGQAEVAIDLHDGRIAWRDQLRATAPIGLTLQGSWGAGALTTASGQIDIADARALGVDAKGLHAAFTADPDGVTLRDATWHALGAAWRQRGTVRLTDTVTVDGALDADAVDGAALVVALRSLLGDAVAPLRLEGPARLHLGASGAVGGPISGQLAVSLSTGSAGWATGSATAPLALSTDVTVQSGAIVVRNGHAQAAAIADRDLTATALDARFAFADDAVQLEALRARAFDGDWTVSGTVPLHGQPTVNVAAVGINAAHLARAFLTGQREDAGTAGDVDVTATLRGTGGAITLRLASPTLTLGPLHIAQPASASGTLAWRNGALQVRDGRAQLARVRVADTDVGNVRAAFASAGPDRLRVAPLTGRAFGGTWSVDATLGRDEIDGTIRASGVALDPMLAALDAGPRSERAVASFTATLQRPRQGATTADVAVQLTRGRFFYDTLTVVAPARGNATVRLDGDRWAVEHGTASAAAASYAMLHGTQASARLEFDPDQIRFADLRVTAAGAPWQGSGRIDLTTPPRVDGAVAVTRADPDTVLRMVGVTAPTLDPDGLDLSLRVRSPLGDGWRQGLQGSGSLALRGGVLASTGLLRAVVAAVVPSRQLREGGPPNRLESLTLTFTLADGSARTDDLSTRSDDYDLSAAGIIGLDGRLDLDGRVTLTPNGIKKMFALSNVPIPGSSLLSLPTIPTRIDGSLEEPRVHPEAAALAGTTARWFAAALIGAPARTLETVGRPIERFFGDMRDLVAPPAPTPTGAP